MHYVVKFKRQTEKRSQLVAKVTQTGDVIPTRLRIHAIRLTKESADKLVADIRAAGWIAHADPA